jgi:aerobic C4-dicarboxylate transport protein
VNFVKRFRHSLYLQVITAVIIGVAVGHFFPDFGASMKPFGDGFIKLVKMLIAPIVFCTVVTGIAKMGDLKKVGRVGLKALVYFEVLSTIALFIGLLVGKLVKAGAGMNVDVASLDAKAVASYTAPSAHLSTIDFLLNVIPKDVADAFARGDILQVLFFASLFGVALAAMREAGKPVLIFVDGLGHVLFRIVGIVMRVAPLGAFGAMAFTIGKFGIGTLLSMGELVACFYATSLLFVFLLLGGVMRLCSLNIFKFVRYIKEEILLCSAPPPPSRRFR